MVRDKQPEANCLSRTVVGLRTVKRLEDVLLMPRWDTRSIVRDRQNGPLIRSPNAHSKLLTAVSGGVTDEAPNDLADPYRITGGDDIRIFNNDIRRLTPPSSCDHSPHLSLQRHSNPNDRQRVDICTGCDQQILDDVSHLASLLNNEAHHFCAPRP